MCYDIIPDISLFGPAHIPFYTRQRAKNPNLKCSFLIFSNCTSGPPVPDGDDLPEVQLVVVDLSNKDGGHGLVQRCAVHVNGCAHRQHKANDAPVDVVVLQQALKSDGQCGRAETHTQTV